MTRRSAALIFVLSLFALVYGLLGADEFRWTKDLDSAFLAANEKGGFVVVLASKDLTDPRAASAAKALSSKLVSPLAASFVGLRLSGAEAEEFARKFSLRGLPAAAVLAPSGAKLAEVSAGSLESLPFELARVAGRTRIEPNPFKLAEKMRSLSDRIASAPDLGLLADQYGVLLSLDRLIEQARPRKSRQSANPLVPRRDEGDEKQGGSKGSGKGGGNAGGGGGDGSGGSGRGGKDVTSAEWGKLPPRLREDASDASSEEIPPAYRELVEEYFKRLMR